MRNLLQLGDSSSLVVDASAFEGMIISRAETLLTDSVKIAHRLVELTALNGILSKDQIHVGRLGSNGVPTVGTNTDSLAFDTEISFAITTYLIPLVSHIIIRYRSQRKVARFKCSHTFGEQNVHVKEIVGAEIILLHAKHRANDTFSHTINGRANERVVILDGAIVFQGLTCSICSLRETVHSSESPCLNSI